MGVLQAYGVWWFPPMVLNCAAVLLSLAWGLLIFTLSWLRWQSSVNGTMVPCLAVMSTTPHLCLPGLRSFGDTASTVFQLAWSSYMSVSAYLKFVLQLRSCACL